jgi:hypothetical protein
MGKHIDVVRFLEGTEMVDNASDGGLVHAFTEAAHVPFACSFGTEAWALL